MAATERTIPRKEARPCVCEKQAKVHVESPAWGRISNASPPCPYLFTVADYYTMGNAGIFKPDERVELVEGEVIMMSPIDPPHAEGTHQTCNKLASVTNTKFRVRCQHPVRLSPVSEPVPDVSVVKIKSYKDHHPGPADVLLIVEVANTSKQQDLGPKRLLYAASKIPEYWVLDVKAGELHVFTKPRRGDYADHRTLTADEIVKSATLPKVVVKVSDLLP